LTVPGGNEKMGGKKRTERPPRGRIICLTATWMGGGEREGSVPFKHSGFHEKTLPCCRISALKMPSRLKRKGGEERERPRGRGRRKEQWYMPHYQSPCRKKKKRKSFQDTLALRTGKRKDIALKGSRLSQQEKEGERVWSPRLAP